MTASTSSDPRPGRTDQRQATVTRPANATQYHAGDVIGTAVTANLTFSDMAPVAGYGGTIHAVTIDKTDADTTGFDVDLILFTAAPAAIADHAAYSATDAERLNIVGIVEFLNTDASSSSVGDTWQRTQLDIKYVTSSTSKALTGILVMRGTYTPASGELFAVTLQFEVD